MNKKKKHIICYSGGESSAIVAVECKRKFGKENIILLNHDINPRFENEDIKRFKKEVSDYLGVKITYANVDNELTVNKIRNQFEVCIKKGTFVNPANRQILCTYVLKTDPFYNYLKELDDSFDYVIYYGFDKDELSRVERRKIILNDSGFDSDYPIALWGEGSFQNLKEYFNKKKINFESICKTENFINKDHYERTIFNIEDVGIKKPNTYGVWKHANCTGCLKAGKQHWYVVYCVDYEIFEMGKNAEEIIGHSFGKEFLKDIEPMFKRMKEIGIPANENIPSGKFWKSAKKYINQTSEDLFPCECFI